MAGEPLLVVDRVTKRFGGLVALDSVSFTVNPGERVGLIGPNGAGKTTLFNCIAGVYRPDKGRILFEGRDITGWPPHRVARIGVGRTFQLVRPLRKLSVLDNVAVGALLHTNDLEEARRAALEVLELVGLYEKRMHPASSLTLVEKKRLEVARALALRPKLLLLDEIAAGLRPSEVDRLLEMLFEVNRRGITMIMVEHVMRAVMNFAERVIVLQHGRKIAEGSPEEVSRNPLVIDAYLGTEE